MEVLLLAERLRVEERLLIDAFSAAGWVARLVTPGEMRALALGVVEPSNGRDESRPYDVLRASQCNDCVAVSRLLPTRETAALAWVLEGAGMRVVNSPGAQDLLSRRDRLIGALAAAGIGTPAATLAWGQAALLEAAGLHGWPVELLPLEGGQPGIVVEDLEAAEAIIEHRAVLGSERVMLARRAVPEHEQRRLLVAGEFVQAAQSRDGGWIAGETTEIDRQLAGAVARVTGGQLLDVLYLPGGEPVVTFVGPLNGFRDLQSVEVDIAGAVAACLTGMGAAYV